MKLKELKAATKTNNKGNNKGEKHLFLPYEHVTTSVNDTKISDTIR